jgi:hypothetical protein
MTRFLLAGTRPPRPGSPSEPGGPGDPGELALAAAAHRVVAAAAWYSWLRRWGLLLSFAATWPSRPAGWPAC